MNEAEALARCEATLAEIDALIPGGDLAAPVVDRVRAFVDRRQARAMQRAATLDHADLDELREAYRESDEANERQREIIETLMAAAPSPLAFELVRAALRLARELAGNELEQRGVNDAAYDPRAGDVLDRIDAAVEALPR